MNIPPYPPLAMIPLQVDTKAARYMLEAARKYQEEHASDITPQEMSMAVTVCGLAMLGSFLNQLGMRQAVDQLMAMAAEVHKRKRS